MDLGGPRRALVRGGGGAYRHVEMPHCTLLFLGYLLLAEAMMETIQKGKKTLAWDLPEGTSTPRTALR